MEWLGPAARRLTERTRPLDDESASRELVERVGPLWSERRTSEALSKTPTELEELAAEGRLLRLEDSDGTAWFPLWQLTTTPSGVQVRPHVEAMLRPLAGQDPWAVALVLFCAPVDELDGLTPVAAAKGGWPVDELVDFAHMVASEWGRP